MNCFRYFIKIPDSVRDSFPTESSASSSVVHHLVPQELEKVSTMSLLAPALNELANCKAKDKASAAETIRLTLEALMDDPRVKQSLAEFYGVKHLHASLQNGIASFKRDGTESVLLGAAAKIQSQLGPSETDVIHDPEAVALAS